MYDISNNRLGVNTPSPSDTLRVTGKINCTDGKIVRNINFDSETGYYEFVNFTSPARFMRTVSMGSDVNGTLHVHSMSIVCIFIVCTYKYVLVCM
jgi:hypothetical protein